jgi:putative nucleotidyltransferase with HDIG domain
MISKVKNVAEKLMTDHQRWQKFVRLLRSQGMLASFETEFFCKDESRLWVQVSARIVYDQRSGRIHYFETFIEDISHRKKVEMDISHILETQEKALTNTIQTISKISEIRDPYTAGHQRRVTQLAVAIAREMQLEQPLIEALNTASMLHDIGKAYVPAEILTKPGKLSDAEMRLVRNHPATGYDIVRQIDFQKPIADIILQHHERMDGSGYPNGLKGDAIMKEARILAVADVVEAMATDRPFRTEYGIEKALEEIENKRGTLYDPEAVDACLRLCRHRGFVFSNVLMSTTILGLAKRHQAAQNNTIPFHIITDSRLNTIPFASQQLMPLIKRQTKGRLTSWALFSLNSLTICGIKPIFVSSPRHKAQKSLVKFHSDPRRRLYPILIIIT